MQHTHNPQNEKSGIRESINKHPGRVFAVIIVLLAIGILLMIREYHTPSQKAYYTTDDGATTFVLTWKAAPFDYEGKSAVEAVMFSCDHGKTRFVGYLKRYTAKGQEMMPKYISHQLRMPQPIPADLYEVKRPGAAGKWAAPMFGSEIGSLIAQGKITPEQATEYGSIMQVKCPDGKGIAVPVGAD